MQALVFLVVGLGVAVLTERLIARLTPEPGALDASDDDFEAETERLERRRLPWQTAPWPPRLRRGVAFCLPLLMALAGWRFEAPQAALVSLLLVGLLIITATDLLQYRVPDVITFPGTLLALAAALLMPHAGILSALAAAAFGAVSFFLLAILTRGGLGLGDVKLAMLIGAALGLPAAFQALALGIIAGGVVILALFVAGVVSRRQAVPYAPFLALAAVLVVLLKGASFAPI